MTALLLGIFLSGLEWHASYNWQVTATKQSPRTLCVSVFTPSLYGFSINNCVGLTHIVRPRALGLLNVCVTSCNGFARNRTGGIKYP